MVLSELREHPVFWWSRIFGLFPFGGEGRLSKCWLLYSCVMHSLARTISMALLIYHWTLNPSSWNLKLHNSIIYYGQNSLLILTPLLQFGFLMDDPQCLERTLRTIFRLNPSRIKTDNLLKLYLCGSAAAYAIHFVVFPLTAIISLVRPWNLVIFNMTLLCNELSCMLIILQFILVLDEISRKVISLTDGLLFEPERYCDLFQNCVDLAAEVNSMYTRQNLTMLAKIFVQLCSSAFYLLTSSNSRVPKIVWFLRLPFIFQQVFAVCSIVGAAEKFKSSAEKFNSELFRLMRENKELCKNEKLQLYVTMKQTVNFTACGFFTLGYPLVTSIIAAATTYLVILVQFSMPPPNTNPKT